ncbi:MAG TPA: RnfABCDGE type electron transport complex subunit D, partial [Pseudomonas sp.]|nr:RnfABCDGE type electron transport complex subunit D [Pseudomonas sp.]
MALPRITSPHATGANRTQRVMLTVLAATLPGILVLTWLYGAGTLINLVWASALALGFEALLLKLRERPVRFFLRDGSALVTAVLLALALPPYSPWWLTAVAVGSAIVL